MLPNYLKTFNVIVYNNLYTANKNTFFHSQSYVKDISYLAEYDLLEILTKPPVVRY